MSKVEIQVGTTFLVSERTNLPKDERTFVATGLGEENYFYASKIIQLETGNKIIIGGGVTTYLSDIQELIGRMNPDEVIEAFRNGWKVRCRSDCPRDVVEDLENEAKKGSRTLGDNVT